MSDSRGYDEESERLLTGPNLGSRRTRRRLFLWSLFAFIVAISVITLIVSWANIETAKPKYKRNVILMISDGFGPASETFARTYYQFINDLPYNYTTSLDEILVGTSRTRSSDSLVTDSAAGATAFSCAIKTYNEAIGVDPNQVPCGTVLESAKAHGMATGLVVTSRITHATPASFSAHVINRTMESEIAVQQIGDYPLGRQVDLMFGGGRCFFLANSTEGSCRTDDHDVLSDAKRNNFNYISTRHEFDSILVKAESLPILGLFTLDHMAFEIDRDPAVEPSLKEMSEKALQLLEQSTSDSDKGFFLMIEGSKIDMAAHSNDPATHVHDIIAYHEAVSVVREFVDSHPGSVMISTSDHETGGLTLARQINLDYPEYLWYPGVIQRVQNSSFVLANELDNYDKDDRIDFIRNTVLRKGLGIDDFTKDDVDFLNSTRQDPMEVETYLANLTSFRAQLGWTTHGHSAVDVNLYAHGLNSNDLKGNHENTDIGDFITEFLNLDLQTITEKLNKNNATFHLNAHPTAQSNVDHLAHYYHDY